MLITIPHHKTAWDSGSVSGFVGTLQLRTERNGLKWLIESNTKPNTLIEANRLKEGWGTEYGED